MRRQEFDVSFEGASRIAHRARTGLIKTAFIFQALGNSVSMWQRRGSFLSLSLPSSPSRFLGCIFFPPIHYPPVTRNHPSFAVAKFLPLLPFTALPPCTPSTGVLFYFIIRPDLDELGCCLGVYTGRPLSPLSLSSSPRPPRFSTNGETGISASNTRVLCRCRCSSGSLLSSAFATSSPRPPPLPLPPPLLLFYLSLIQARLQLVCLGFGTSISRRREDPSRLSFYRSSCLPRLDTPSTPVTEVARIKFMHG